MRTIDGYPIDSAGSRRRSDLERLKLPLPGNETLQTTGLHEFVLLLRELGQPIGGCPQILTEHRPTSDHLVLDCLLDQLVLANA